MHIKPDKMIHSVHYFMICTSRMFDTIKKSDATSTLHLSPSIELSRERKAAYI